jgi:CBS domain containing-hemolysin-like protein
VNGLKVIIAAVLVGVNAFFVVAEYALVRSRRVRLEVMREQGVRGAALALAQLKRVNDYISAVQIGVTITSIAIGALGEPALAALLKGALGSGWDHGVAAAVLAVVAFAVIALTQLIGG